MDRNRNMTRRRFLQATAGVGGVVAFGGLAAACSTGGAGGSTPPLVGGSTSPQAGGSTPPQGGTINFLTWSDHWTKDQLAGVAASTGITANVTELSDDSDGFAKLSQVHGQLDLVSGDALWEPKYYESGLIEAFDINSLQVAQELYTDSKKLSFWTTTEGYLAFPRGWSPRMIYFNPKYVSPAPDGWDVLIDPKYKRRVIMENLPTSTTIIAGIATRAKDPNMMTDAELATATDWMKQLKPNVLKLVAQADEAVAGLVDESAWIVVTNIGAEDRVKDRNGPEVKSILPKEGVNGWIDGEMIVMGGRNEALVRPYLEASQTAEYIAQAFLDYGHPLFNEKAYTILVNKGQKDRADRYLYNHPEVATKAILEGPGPRVQDYINAFNSVFA